MNWPGKKDRREAELEEELRAHLDMAAADRVARGASQGEAEAGARREFGNVGLIKEATRETWGTQSLAWLGQDIRYALRALARSPGFAAVAIVSLGLGIGANTVAFSVMDGFLRRPLPVPQPERLVYLREHGWSARANDELDYLVYTRLRDESRTLASLAAENIFDRSPISISGAGGGADPGGARVAVITGNYFATLGVGAGLGRTLTPDDDRVLLGHPVVMISDDYWARRLGRAPDVLGRTLQLNATSYTIVGVGPRDFSGDWVGRPVDLWIPFAMHQRVIVEVPRPLNDGNARWLHLIGRLAPGVSLSQAGAEIQSLYQQELSAQLGANPAAESLRQMAQRHLDPLSGRYGYSEQREAIAQPIAVLSLVVGLVLLVGCANLAGLLLARAAAREHELSVRLAIGAGRGRLIRQLLTESLVLSGLGGLLGVILALWGVRLLADVFAAGPVQMFFGRSSWIVFDLHVNLGALGFTLGLCLVTGLLFGLTPALIASRLAPAASLGGRTPGTGGVHRLRPGKALVVLQVALSLVVLVAAVLFFRSLHNLRTQDLGFHREGILQTWTQPSSTARDTIALRALWHDAQERLLLLPGVTQVGASNQGLLNGMMPVSTQGQIPLRIDGEEPRTVTVSMFRTYVTPGFFATMGIPLLAGRDFTEFDTDTAPRVMIISRSMATFYFGSADPVGRRVHLSENDANGITIIGVVGDLLSGTPRAVGVPQLLWYLSYRDRESARRLQSMMIAVRTTGDPHRLVPSILRELQAVDPTLPVVKTNTVDEQLDDVLAQDRLVAGLAMFFALLAVLLACLGLYGLVAYTTARRSSELGVRMALGATSGGLLRLVLKESAGLGLAGVVLGVPAALGAASLIGSRLFEVGVADPFTLVTAATLMLVITALSALVPALRAASTDPIVALRTE